MTALTDQSRLLQELATVPQAEAALVIANHESYLERLPNSAREALLAACQDILKEKA
jgi:hypothetical protein